MPREDQHGSEATDEAHLLAPLSRFTQWEYNRRVMNEHYCPFCRVELMADNHRPDCIPGDSFGGQTYRIGLLVDDLTATMVAEARKSLPGQALVWLVDHLPGHSLRPSIR